MDHTLQLYPSSPTLTDSTKSQLRQEHQAYQALFKAQTVLVQQYLSVQAASLAGALARGAAQARFTLPDAVAYTPESDGPLEIERVRADSRRHFVGSWIDRLRNTNLEESLCQRLVQLERSPDRVIAVSAGLLRYTIATHMVHHMLPAGRSVIYTSAAGYDIPNEPVETSNALGSAINSGGEAYWGPSQDEKGRGELPVPYSEAARRFYLPQWVAFDDHGKLLVGTVSEAEAYIASMQGYLAILNSAVMIAPYMVTDETWQQKHYGMLGQLVNQGRTLAHYYLDQIIQTIDRRVNEHRLDRGLSLSLPYFNDQTLKVENYNFQVIPAGRVMFIPAFVVLAVRTQAVKVARDTSLSQSTRRHLLMALSTLEEKYLR